MDIHDQDTNTVSQIKTTMDPFHREKVIACLAERFTTVTPLSDVPIDHLVATLVEVDENEPELSLAWLLNHATDEQVRHDVLGFLCFYDSRDRQLNLAIFNPYCFGKRHLP
jgi:hypothetical protein